MSQEIELITTLTPYITLVIGFILGLIGTALGIFLTQRLQTKQSTKQKQHQLYAELVSCQQAMVHITTHSAKVQINCDYYHQWRDLLTPSDPRRREVSEDFKSWFLFSLQVELERIPIYTKFYETIVSMRSVFPHTEQLKKHLKKCYLVSPFDMTDISVEQIKNHSDLDKWVKAKDKEIKNAVREQVSRPISECIAFLKKYTNP